jgi:hypothetical protein
METPITNIDVKMTIPSQTYRAVAMEIMEQYSKVTSDALNEVKEALLFDEKFQEEVKNTIKRTLQEAVENAIRSAARSVVWDLYGKNSIDIEEMVKDAILSTIRKK